jgi:hypothetical protein
VAVRTTFDDTGIPWGNQLVWLVCCPFIVKAFVGDAWECPKPSVTKALPCQPILR